LFAGVSLTQPRHGDPGRLHGQHSPREGRDHGQPEAGGDIYRLFLPPPQPEAPVPQQQQPPGVIAINLFYLRQSWWGEIS
jgi:hypothetical protein